MSGNMPYGGCPPLNASCPGCPQQNTQFTGCFQNNSWSPAHPNIHFLGYPAGHHQGMVYPHFSPPSTHCQNTTGNPNNCIFMLKSLLNGKVVDVARSGGSGTNVISHPVNHPATPNQLWKPEHAGNGWFFLVSCLNPQLVLDVYGGQCGEGTKVIVWEKKMPPCPNQLWRVSGNFIESALGHNMVLDISGRTTPDGPHVVINPRRHMNCASQIFEVRPMDTNCHHEPLQQHITSPQPLATAPPHPHSLPGAFMLKSRLNGKVLDVEGSGGSGTNVISYHENHPVSPNQLWTYEHAGNGQFFLVSCMNRNLVLDVCGGSCREGTKVIVWEKKMPPSPNQLWRIRGQFIESGLGHNMVLDISGGNTRDGANIIIYPRKQHGTANQNWEVHYI